MLILGQHVRMDQALDWKTECSHPCLMIFGITFREHCPLPALFLLCCPVLCTLGHPALASAASDTDRNPLDTLSDIHSSLAPNLTKNSLCSFSRSHFLRFAPAIPPPLQDVIGAEIPQNSP